MKNKTFKIYTFGCKVNQYESQRIREKLLNAGINEAKEDMAGIYIVNTCTVTEKADSESRGIIRRIHRENPAAEVFAVGCSVDNSPSKFESMPQVKQIISNAEKEDVLNFVIKDNTPDFDREKNIREFRRHTRAFVKVQDGCDNGCSYCIVPKVRGSARSRALPEVKKEVNGLADNGYKEVVLCGICLGAYGKDLSGNINLKHLIEELEGIDNLLRLRLSSIEASDITPELIKKFSRPGKLCPHLHIPFQSGDDKLLKLMNRKLNSAGYLRILDSLRSACPDIGITTDIMIGFPGEDNNSFKNTLKFLKQAKPFRVHIFTYSPRENTPAAKFTGLPKGDVIKRRRNELRLLGKELREGFYNKFAGRKLPVLVESALDPKTGLYKGYSGNYIKVYLRCGKAAYENKLITLEITRPYLDGCIASPS